MTTLMTIETPIPRGQPRVVVALEGSEYVVRRQRRAPETGRWRNEVPALGRFADLAAAQNFAMSARKPLSNSCE